MLHGEGETSPGNQSRLEKNKGRSLTLRWCLLGRTCGTSHGGGQTLVGP